MKGLALVLVGRVDDFAMLSQLDGHSRYSFCTLLGLSIAGGIHTVLDRLNELEGEGRGARARGQLRIFASPFGPISA